MIDKKSGYVASGGISLSVTLNNALDYKCLLAFVTSMDWAGDMGSGTISVTSGGTKGNQFTIISGVYYCAIKPQSNSCIINSYASVSGHSCNSTLIIYGF